MAAVATGLVVLLMVALTWYWQSRRAATRVGTPRRPPPWPQLPARKTHPPQRPAVQLKTRPMSHRSSRPFHRTKPRVPVTNGGSLPTPTARAQAGKKAATLAQKHPELQPKVFRPNGVGPYLVTVGGTMGKDEAFALIRKVRQEGLPHDIYAQNYRSSDH